MLLFLSPEVQRREKINKKQSFGGQEDTEAFGSGQTIKAKCKSKCPKRDLKNNVFPSAKLTFYTIPF